ncbi:MAG: Ig domain-containing protein [Spartobacteria bacterium]
MPRGLSLDPSTGVLSGTPGELKTGTIMIRVADSTGFPSTRSIPVSITTDPLEIIHEPASFGVEFCVVGAVQNRARQALFQNAQRFADCDCKSEEACSGLSIGIGDLNRGGVVA